MERVTFEQYEAAKLIVDQYNSQLEAEFKEKTAKIGVDLEEYFKQNEVCGCKIEKFGLKDTTWFGPKTYKRLDIIPIEPYFDENYWDDKADADIEAIGQKYGIQLGWVSDVYGK